MAEILAAAALMSVVIVVTLPIVSSAAAVREESAQRHRALIEVSNVLEEIAAQRMQGGDLTEEQLEPIALPANAAAMFDQPELDVQLAPPAGEPPARELSVALTWLNGAGERVVPVRITAFLYEAGESL